MKGDGDLTAVIGAGPAGAMAAFLLAVKGRPVVLLDDERPSPERIEMLPPRAVLAFHAGGLGQALDDRDIAVPCRGIVRRGAVEDREDFLLQPGSGGLAVHRPAFDAAIRTAARTAGAKCLSGRLTAIEDKADGFVMRIAAIDGSLRIGARTIIDASGRAAAVSRRLGARLEIWEHLVAERTDNLDGPDLWLNFALDREGWVYAITGPGARRDAWHVGPPSRPRMGHHAVDASARRLSPAAGHRWIAIGDAASAFDPICCQGLAHAASSALAAAGMIAKTGTVLEDDAELYDLACQQTAVRTEGERRAVYEHLRLGSASGAQGAVVGAGRN